MTSPGQVIAWVGAKGGVGTTTLACGFAALLSQDPTAKVCIVSFNWDPGRTMEAVLGCSVAGSITDCWQDITLWTKQDISKYVTKVFEGLDCIAGPENEVVWQKILCADVEKLLHLLTMRYRYVVLDIGHQLSLPAIASLNLADQVALVATMDVMSLRAAVLQRQELVMSGISPITVVVNRVDPKRAAQEISEAKRILEVETVTAVPRDDKSIQGALEKQEIFTIAYPGSSVTKALAYLCEELGFQPRPARRLSLIERYRRRRLRRQLGRSTSARDQEIIADTDLKAQYAQIKTRLHEAVVKELLASNWDLSVPWQELSANETLRHEIQKICMREMAEQGVNCTEQVKRSLIQEIIDETLGLGPLEKLLADDSVSEIMVNGSQSIYVETDGKLRLTDLTFANDLAVMHVIERIVAPLGRRIDESSPMVDARLPDGSRVNAIIPPLALNGPILTIRKFARKALTMEDLLVTESISMEMAEFLRCAVLARKNIIIAGGTGSGKTTLLNVLSSFIPSGERIVTIEDAAELRLMQEHVCRLEAKPANVEGKGAVTIRDLVKNALRMRPDRIIVGECRGGEVIDMLQAMNTGHDGSLTTIHANSARDCISRLETMVLLGGVDLPVQAIREQISSAIDLIVYQNRFPDGSRKICSITEVGGMESGHIVLRDLYEFKQLGFDEETGVIGEFVSHGIGDHWIADFCSYGLELSFLESGAELTADSHGVSAR